MSSCCSNNECPDCKEARALYLSRFPQPKTMPDLSKEKPGMGYRRADGALVIRGKVKTSRSKYQ